MSIVYPETCLNSVIPADMGLLDYLEQCAAEARAKAEAKARARSEAKRLRWGIGRIAQVCFPNLKELARERAAHIQEPAVLREILLTLLIVPDEHEALDYLQNSTAIEGRKRGSS